MTTVDEFDRLLDEWFAGAAATATPTMPEGLHHHAMERVQISPQHRSWWAILRARVTRPQSRPAYRVAYIGLIVAAVTAVSLGALILASGGGPTPGTIVVSSSSPTNPTSAPPSTQTPAPDRTTEPLPTAPPTKLATAGFVRPFAYSIPDASLRLFHGGCPRIDCDFYVGPDENLEDPGFAHPRASDLHGVIVASLDNATINGCPAQPPINGPPSPSDFVADLRAIVGTSVTVTSSTVLDSRLGQTATVTPETAPCDRASVDLGFNHYGGEVSLAIPSRLTVLDVDGSLVLIDVWARTTDDLEAWLPVAQAFADSINFLEPGESDGPKGPKLIGFGTFEYTLPADGALRPGGTDAGAVSFYEGPAEGHYAQDPTDGHPIVRPSDQRGVLVMAIKNAWVHACLGGAGRTWIRTTPREFLDDLHAVAGIALADVTPTALDGQAAYMAGVRPDGAQCQGPDLHLGPIEGLSSGSGVPLDLPSHLIVADLDGGPVMVEVWARTSDDLADWLPTASGFVDTLHFSAQARPGGVAPPPMPAPTSATGALVAATFVQPFEYALPSPGSLELRACREFACVFYEGVHDTRPGGSSLQRPGDDHGVIVVNLDQTCSESCIPPVRSQLYCGTQAPTPTGSTPDEFLEAVRATIGIGLAGITPTSLDGRPALSARSNLDASTCEAGNLYLEDESGGHLIQLSFPSRLVVGDVAGIRVLVDVWARSDEDLDAWSPVAQEFLDSIHFTGAP